ncbi:MAG: N-ethylammeline chlorohydrolase [Deltaproteobacteria bacterium]|nr:MAG: N-ethylammeline chlorohydrolase [Deltaproteobacteria bacterium]
MTHPSFRLVDATLVTMDDDDHILRGTLAVLGGRIAYVGADDTLPDELAHLPPIRCGGDYVLPGFVQAHIHLCQTLFRHEAESRPLLAWLRERIWPLEGSHTPETLALSAELGVLELLRGGTTCLLDMGTVHHQEAVFEVARRTGIRGAFGKAMMDVGDEVPDTLRETTAESLDESIALARRWHGAEEDRIRYAFAPRFVLSCSDDLQREVARHSAEQGWLIHTHASEHAEEVAFIESTRGMRNVTLLHELGLCGPRSVFAHGVQLDDHERHLLRESATTICHCPSSNLKLGSGIADVLTLLRQGVNVALGADGAPCNNGLDAFTEMRLAHLLQGPRHGAEALNARRVLHMATRAGARALGWEDRIGSLEVGKDADLVRLDRSDPRLGLGSDPFTEIVCAGVRDLVRDVWVRGEQLVADRAPTAATGLDPARLLAEGSRALRGMLDTLD